ncbi:MAG: 4Fe-4S binding protein, partial [Lachnospiraceae bacterium]|nr:4Fe-4S binding protein [Lachnospiraceae bacterium]
MWQKLCGTFSMEYHRGGRGMDYESLVFTNDRCIGCNKCINSCPAMGACTSRGTED